MKISLQIKSIAWAGGLLLLSACLNPYALNIRDVDYYSNQSEGVIQITDAKLYSREALINERRDETEYLTELLKKSRSIEFAPQIMREVEYISSISASLGLSFNPAAGNAYQQELATSQTQQEIDELALQLQLESLRRDAVLLREEFAARTTALSDPLSADVSSGAPTSDLSGAATGDLITSINALLSRLEARLDKSVPGVQSSKAAIDPSDLFLDRAAYRDLIKSAMSAERLDDLHDKNGSALMRFHFGATVLPPSPDKMDTLGVLRMQVIKPTLSAQDYKDLYRLWLNYINESYNLIAVSPAPDKKLAEKTTDAELDGAQDASSEEEAKSSGEVTATSSGPVAKFSYAPNPRIFYLGADENLFETVSFALPVAESNAGKCKHVRLGVSSFDEECAAIYIAVPVSSGRKVQDGDAIRSTLLGDAPTKIAAMEKAIETGEGTFVTQPSSTSVAAGTPFDNCQGASSLSESVEVRSAIAILEVQETLNEAFRNLLSLSLRNDLPAHQSTFIRENFILINQQFEVAKKLVNVASNGQSDCSADNIFRDNLKVPEQFKKSITAMLNLEDSVRIYDVAPRERAQQISTVTRAAEAINVAAAIAGQLPQAGIGVDAQTAFARSVSGKADARERAPLVVSFAEPRFRDLPADPKGKTNSEVAFGWLLGPRVSVDPAEKRLELSHYTAPYELTADLSLPGWWPYVDLNVQTAWTPDWRQGVGSTLTLTYAQPGDGDAPLRRTLRVPLAPNSSDMSSLTDALIAQQSSFASTSSPTITSIAPSEISACGGSTTLLIEGDNIWRSEKIIVGGKEYSGSRVRVTPDMSGILVDIDARSLPQAKTHVNGLGNADIDVYALNQDGEARGRLILRHLKKDGTCQGQLPKSAVPTITSVTLPKVSVCDPKPVFVINGSTLKGASAVTLGAISGTIKSNTGSAVTVEFPPIKQTLAGIDKANLSLIIGKKPVQHEIEIYTPAKECLK